jgi:hypothetical protein
MRTHGGVALSILISLAPGAAVAQADSTGVARAEVRADSTDAARAEVHAHIVHVSDAFGGAPGGQGLLRIALAEAEIAALHGDLAAQAGTSLADVRLHLSHMLHAIEPSMTLEGPGLGYGLKRATEESLLHLEMAASIGGASDNVRFHALHISTVLGAVLDRADRVVTLARELEVTSSAAAAAPLLVRLSEESAALARGRDIDRDGLVGWQGQEGGMRQANQHMTLLKRGEGLIPRP